MQTRPLSPAPAAHAGADACPGVLRPHQAGDGALIRVRVPGGSMPVSLLQEIWGLASAYGAPFLQLTSRANLQLRGLPMPLPTQLERRLTAVDLMPSPAHERVRNIVANPFSDRAGEVATQLDAELIGRAELANLPGRFLFAVDDPAKPVLGGTGADLTLLPGSDVDTLLVRAARGAGSTHGAVRVEAGTVASVALDIAERFLALRAGERVWRIDELPVGAALLGGDSEPANLPATDRPGPGRHGRYEQVAVPFGLLSQTTLESLLSLADDLGTPRLTLTPWRAVALRTDRASDVERALARATEAGLSVQADEFSAAVTTCIGAPWCSRTDVDTHSLTTALLAQPGRPTTAAHVSGCERRCGAPQAAHADLVANSASTPISLLAQWKEDSPNVS